MFGVSPSLAAGVIRVYLHAHPTDMRRSYDGLCALIESAFQRDVRCGELFLFLNRRLDRVKLMYWDRDGIAIWMKRLECGTFQRPALTPDGTHAVLDATDLSLLLSGIDLRSAQRRKRYALPSLHVTTTCDAHR
jgi:transposase